MNSQNTLPYHINVFDEVKELALLKYTDYQNPNSNIKNSDYYPSGLDSILDLINMKILRIESLITVGDLNKIEDNLKDLMTYAAISISYIRGKVDGQDPKKNFLNK